MAGWFRKEVHAAGDFQGLKMRIGGFAGKVFQMLGAEPVAMPKDGIYPALESGALDAMEWVGPYDDEKFGERKEGDKLNLSKVAPYYYYPGWWKGGMQLHLIVDREKFDALPKSYQAAFRAAAAVANASVQAKYDAANPGALKRLVVGGAELRLFPQDVIEACYKTANDLYAQLGARKSQIQEDRRFLYGVPRRPIFVVAGRRIFLRQFHDPPAARQELRLAALFSGRQISLRLLADDGDEIAHREIGVDEVQTPFRQRFAGADHVPRNIVDARAAGRRMRGHGEIGAMSVADAFCA